MGIVVKIIAECSGIGNKSKGSYYDETITVNRRNTSAISDHLGAIVAGNRASLQVQLWGDSL
jgi:hypothetical protein